MIAYTASALLAVLLVVALTAAFAGLLRIARAGYDRLLELEDDRERGDGWETPEQVRGGR